ncbi:CAT RNA binding domain-containing protein [Cryobacterium sp. Y11]|uniref:CAT RNA binding domain-containing protein n=1 Tax=Cryobacterium sp. Y11 TaxID=2045016 RepID=UPI000CE504CB|nr:CAT RNA binding domain-containing protein [Cryobacterium sp. Y11]
MARSQATIAHKVLNNVVISIDELGQERVLMGRGLGFQLLPTDSVDPAKVEKTFILEQCSGADHARQLLVSVPYP